MKTNTPTTICACYRKVAEVKFVYNQKCAE